MAAGLGDGEGAQAALREVIKSRPRDSLAYYNLATILHKEGKLDESIELYRRAVTLRGRAPDYHFNFGLCLYERGDIDSAIAEFEKVRELRPKDREAIAMLDLLRQAKAPS